MARRRARRRPNHGRAVPAAELAWSSLAQRVARDDLRLARIRVAWATIARGPLREQVWPAALRGGELVLHVRNSQWVHELTYLRSELLQRIRANVVDVGVEALRVRVGDVPPPIQPERLSLPRRRGPDLLPVEPSPATLEALEGIRDAELRHAIATARVALSRD